MRHNVFYYIYTMSSEPPPIVQDDPPSPTNSAVGTDANHINLKLEQISVDMNPIRTEHSRKSEYNLYSTMHKVKKQRELHRMCAQHYEFMNSMINIPAIAISGAATVYSFAYPSDGNSQQIFTSKVIAGSLSAVNTILFSVGSFLKFQARAESHFIAAEEYDNLVTLISFEIQFPNENIQAFANKIEKKILEIKKSCRYFPPDFIVSRYDREHPKKSVSDNDSDYL